MWLCLRCALSCVSFFLVDDAATKAPMAVLWNYAMHGTCFGASNLMQSGDIMGMTNAWIESQMASTETIVRHRFTTSLCDDGLSDVLCFGV